LNTQFKFKPYTNEQEFAMSHKKLGAGVGARKVANPPRQMKDLE